MEILRNIYLFNPPRKLLLQMMKDTGLIDSQLTQTDVDITFAKFKTKGKKKMTYEQFESALGHVAEKKARPGTPC
jgi:hypothetical protein